MIVPQFWAESRVQHRADGKQITIRRFGWSDESQDDAQAAADARAKEALLRAVSGEKLARREPKVAYNGADGVPIREEVLARVGDMVITRNVYGAKCLNTPGALFADVDFPVTTPGRLTCSMLLGALAAGIGIGFSAGSVFVGFACTVLCVILALKLADLSFRASRRIRGGDEAVAFSRVNRFLSANPGWRVRVYRTPAGLRLLAMHRLFDSLEPEVDAFFTAIGTDPVYARMCKNQRCFRARLTPKPWRIGVNSHLRPRPGVWPVKPEYHSVRAEWFAEYEAKSTEFAACKFVGEFGSGAAIESLQQVRALHDEMCRADSGLPLA